MQEQQNNEKQQNSNPKTDQPGVGLNEFSLEDLSRLTFRLDGAQELDCWSSTAVQFQTYVQKLGTSVENVDTDVWTPFDRLDYLNSLLTFCHAHRRRFPFTLKPVNRPVESDEDDSTSKKATKKEAKEA